MALAYELKLGLMQSTYDLHTVAGVETQHWVPRRNPEQWLDPLKDPEGLNISLRRARAAFALIARVRALWDKLFLFVGEEHDPKAFLAVVRSKKSRKRAFFDTFPNGIGPFTSYDLAQYRRSLEKLEAEYRTPELHGHGAIRLWAFDPIGPWPVDASTPLLGHWSTLNKAIGLLFVSDSTLITSFEAQ